MKKILSIDGGGIRGIIPAVILSEIEKRTGNPCARLFDLIAGTSTGGILGLGLCKPDKQKRPQYSALDLVELYTERGKEIFSRSFWKGMSSVGGLLDEKYPQKPLEKVLQDYFHNTLLKSSLTNLLISSYDLENRCPFFFKSWRDDTNTVAMRHVARATSAAPTYFEPAKIRIGDQEFALIDGGVFVNNPVVSAYAEAKRIFPDEDSFLVVSLGTGQLTRPIHYDEAKDWGLVEWLHPLMSVIFDGVSDAADYQLNLVLEDNFYRFQTRLDIASDDMDNASRANMEALKAEAAQIISNQGEKIDAVCKKLT